MQPRPIAETMSPWLPSFRFSICFPLICLFFCTLYLFRRRKMTGFFYHRGRREERLGAHDVTSATILTVWHALFSSPSKREYRARTEKCHDPKVAMDETTLPCMNSASCLCTCVQLECRLNS